MSSLRGHPASPAEYATKLQAQGRRKAWPTTSGSDEKKFEVSTLSDMAEEAMEEIAEQKRVIEERKAREEEERLRKIQEEEAERRRIQEEEEEKMKAEKDKKEGKSEDKSDDKSKEDKKKKDKDRIPVYGLLFPGQGSESPGMIEEGLWALPGVQELLQKATKILGYSPTDVLHGGNMFWVGDQRIVQPLVYVADLCALEKLRA